MAGAFTPQKSANCTNQGTLTPKSQFTSIPPLGVTTAGPPFCQGAWSMFSAWVKPASLQGPDPALTPRKSQTATLISHHSDNLWDCNSVQQRLRAASGHSGRGLGQGNRTYLLWLMSATDLHCDVGPGPFLFQASIDPSKMMTFILKLSSNFRIQRGCSWTAMQVLVILCKNSYVLSKKQFLAPLPPRGFQPTDNDS